MSVKHNIDLTSLVGTNRYVTIYVAYSNESPGFARNYECF